MAGPAQVADAAGEVVQAAEKVLRNFPDFVASHPELATIRAPVLPGWVLFVAAGAYFLGTVPTRPEGTPLTLVQLYQQVAGNLDRAIDFLETHDLDPEAMRRQLDGIRNLTDGVRRLQAELDRVAGAQEAQVPSPTDILRQELSRLRSTVAVQETWRRGHHGQVHRPLSRAEAEEGGAMVATATAVSSSLTSVVQAIRAVVDHLLPQLRREVVRLLREERELRRSADVSTRAELRTEIRRVVERIGDVVHWLRTEALPDLRERVAAEREARVEAQRGLRVDIRTEAEARTDADAVIMTALAPIQAWWRGPGQRAATKVDRTEGMFDQIMRGADINWIAQLLTGGAFVVLVTRILSRVAGNIPEVLSGLEDAAARAIGAVD